MVVACFSHTPYTEITRMLAKNLLPQKRRIIMRLHKQLRRNASSQGTFAAKVMSFYVITIVTIVSHVLVFWLSTKGSIFPDVDVRMSIITTCAQIIAGLYGITLAGYTFFLSRIDALTASDVTLDYVVGSIKNRFKYLIWFITLNVLITMFVSILLMYMPVPEGEEIGFFYRLFCNEFVLSVVFSIVLILYYSVLVIDPNCIEKEAAKLKKKLSSQRGLPGSAAEFISLYDQIEECCNAMLPASVLRQLHDNKGKRFELTLELLEEQKLLPIPVLSELTCIHRYYECAVNCTSLSVSQEMCQKAGRVLVYLKQISTRPPMRST